MENTSKVYGHRRTEIFLFDIETAGVESTCVVLSAAIVYFDYETDLNKTTYDELIERTLFVKFDVEEQVKAGRTVDKSTMEWWKNQSDSAKKMSLVADPTRDIPVRDGIEALRKYISDKKKGEVSIWVRGSLDQMAIDSLARAFDVDPIARYNCYRDIRTAIDFLSPNSKNGYCEVEAPVGLFDKNKVVKHAPHHDVVYDLFMMVYAEGAKE